LLLLLLLLLLLFLPRHLLSLPQRRFLLCRLYRALPRLP